MSWAKAREEEYLRRMRERGYEDSLRGMDDDDVEWALERMDRERADDVKYILDTMGGETTQDATKNVDADGHSRFSSIDPLEKMRVRGDSKVHTFGDQPDRYSGIHQGVDLHAPVGTPIRAVGNGEIVEARDLGDGGYGKYVIVKFEVNGETFYGLYAHLSELPQEKDENGNPIKVSAGDIIGRTGVSGNAKGMEGDNQHLHFEIATEPTFGTGLGHGRRDPMRFFGTKMKAE